MGQKNELGELELSDEEIQTASDKELAMYISEYNKWRRGEGKYAWHEEPEDNLSCPYTPSTIGILLDEVANRLSASEK